jgi:hypothetical protein
MSTQPLPDIETPHFVPEDNQPGHHPPQDQDKPAVPPRKRKRAPKAPKVEKTATPRTGHFEFAYDPKLASFLFGVTPWTSGIDLDEDRLHIRFGPWSVTTPRDNIASAERSGPYTWWKVAGPAHLSFADGGATFATTTRGGVCLRFKEPVTALAPGGLIRHPGLTITPADPDAFLEALNLEA